MWAAETMSHYLEFLKTEIRRKRQSLQLDATHKALVLCDAASVHSTARFAKIRKTFEKEANAILIHGKDEDGDGLHIPGGWGAAGAPNDAWHQFFHSIRRSWMRVASGSADIAALRRVLHTTELSVDGNPRFELTIQNSLRADAFALQQIQNYRSGKILAWAWVSRGLVTKQQFADARFGGNLEKAQNAIKSAPGELSEIINMELTKEISLEKESQAIQEAGEPLPGEVSSVWCIQLNADSEVIPLPSWFRVPLQHVLCGWMEQAMQWDKKLEQRRQAGRDLTAQQQLKYDAWVGQTQRPLVFNKRTGRLVANPGKETLSRLKKECLLVILHLSRHAEELRLTAGNGQLYKLKLLEIPASKVSSTSVVPEQVDHFSGDMLHQHEGDQEGEEEGGDGTASEADELVMEGESEWVDPDVHAAAEEEGWGDLPDSESDEAEDTPEAAKSKQHCPHVLALRTQPEYLRLRDLNLHTRPDGCILSIHLDGRCWRSQAEGCPHYSRSYNGVKSRNSWQALLRVMELMLQDYCASHPSDKHAKSQLSRIRKLRAEEPAHDD
ncbi:unnamed protein product [Symbiodinium sp. CCMP2592]|nr:unnamed protein product [Symbiodinium sp. CCMP2592]